MQLRLHQLEDAAHAYRSALKAAAWQETRAGAAAGSAGVSSLYPAARTNLGHVLRELASRALLRSDVATAARCWREAAEVWMRRYGESDMQVRDMARAAADADELVATLQAQAQEGAKQAVASKEPSSIGQRVAHAQRLTALGQMGGGVAPAHGGVLS